MLGPERAPAARERALQQRLGLRIATLGIIQHRQIADAWERSGILLAQHALGDRESLFRKRGCLRIFALAIELTDLLVKRVDGVGLL